MSRTRARHLALVNWKGVFYERYSLDDGVTALEGENGAGKTTVMIAAYIVLLPDMSRLRFSTLAESGRADQDRGIWGRLGEQGHAITALDLELPDGGRLVAGVVLERGPKPRVSLSPFLIHDLPATVSLQQVLLDRTEAVEEVPSKPRLKELAALMGGRLEWTDTLRTYFRALFEAGVTPMPLTSDDERNKFDELLRTSMMGGISRQLDDGLRTFLLRPEDGLGQTLERMKGALEECRATRDEVTRSQDLEARVHGILEAGERMFAFALQTQRRAAVERRETADKVQRARDAVHAAHTRHQSAHEQADALAEEASQALDRTDAAYSHTRALLERQQRANTLAKQVQRTRQEVVDGEARLGEVTSEHDTAAAALQAATAQEAAAATARDDAARGLANKQHGLGLLHQRVGRHRAVTRALAEAQRTLPDGSVTPETAAAVRARCDDLIQAATQRASEAATALATAQARRRDFERAHAVLERVVGATPHAEAFARAEEVLAELHALEARSRQADTLREDHAAAARHADVQVRVRQRADDLASLDLPLTSSTNLRADRDRNQARREEADAGHEAATEQLAAAQEEARQAEAEAARLDTQRLRWTALHRVAEALTRTHGQPATTAGQVQALRASLRATLSTLRDDLARCATEQTAAERERHQLQGQGGRFPDALIRVRDAMNARLLVERFEDVGVAEAAQVQARLGPLAHALLVDDAQAAAEQVTALTDRPPELWFVDAQTTAWQRVAGLPGRAHGDAVVVPDGDSVRVSRLPDAPVVGKAARAARIAQLAAQLDALDLRSLGLRETLRAHESDVAEADTLLRDADLLEAVDPSPAREAARARQEASLRRGKDARDRRERAHLAREAARKRLGALDSLMPDAAYLDPPEHGARRDTLAAALREALAAKERLAAVGDDRSRLQAGLEQLRTLPLAEDQLAALHTAELQARQQATAWNTPLQHLDMVLADPEALGWAHLEAQLRADEALVPKLEQQLDEATAALTARRLEATAASKTEASADRALRTADGSLRALNEQLTQRTDELGALDVDDPTDAALHLTRTQLTDLERAQRTQRATREQAMTEAAAHAARRDAAAEQLAGRDKELADALAQAEPAEQRWRGVQEAAEAAGVLEGALQHPKLQDYAGRASVDHRGQRETARVLLLERLRGAPDGEALTEQLAATQRRDTDDDETAPFLRVWLQVRGWLASRVPATLSEGDDPVVALRKLKGHLERLRERLERNETSLRGHAGNIRNDISARIRKSQNLVRGLNRDLAAVGFGSIATIRIDLQRDPAMAEVLEALGGDDAQSLLFSSRMPVEEALDALFAKHGGRRQSGLRLLDYRQYLRLAVQVKRHGTKDWEVARGSNLSTGEAIGVGAAIMMVVLATWERDARLLSGRRSQGTLRFLFLDEATRLSQDSLRVLFDLCRALELQLLIAAPEVAAAEGNTTYLLERGLDEQGRDSVDVTGRRYRDESQP